MKKFDYTVTAEQGLHARPAGLLVKIAASFQSSVAIESGSKSANCKKIFGVMGLGVKKNESVTIKIDGADEDAAMSELQKFMKENF